MGKYTDAADGARQAWECWLADRPITIPDVIETAIKSAFREWLDSNSDAIIERIKNVS